MNLEQAYLVLDEHARLEARYLYAQELCAAFRRRLSDYRYDVDRWEYNQALTKFDVASEDLRRIECQHALSHAREAVRRAPPDRPRQLDVSDGIVAGANLQGANLARANLVGARLEGADLRNANLIGADLTGARLDGAQLCNANLIGANLAGARMEGANLYNACLARADLSGADLTNTRLDTANLARAKLEGTRMVDARLGPWERGWCKMYGDSAFVWPAPTRQETFEGREARCPPQKFLHRSTATEMAELSRDLRHAEQWGGARSEADRDAIGRLTKFGFWST